VGRSLPCGNHRYIISITCTCSSSACFRHCRIPYINARLSILASVFGCFTFNTLFPISITYTCNSPPPSIVLDSDIGPNLSSLCRVGVGDKVFIIGIWVSIMNTPASYDPEKAVYELGCRSPENKPNSAQSLVIGLEVMSGRHSQSIYGHPPSAGPHSSSVHPTDYYVQHQMRLHGAG
jgi:hypothetical protein